jgi:hypothetical protein
MMGEGRVMQEALFYGFSVERHVPEDHLLHKIDRFVDLSALRAHLGPDYSDVGRPSIDAELMMRMLIVGYCLGIRSERRLCEEVHLNLAYRWFCRLGLDGEVPDHSTFSKNRGALKPRCCPNMPARKIARSVHEAVGDKVRAIAKTEGYVVSCRERKKVAMLFAHLKRHPRSR